MYDPTQMGQGDAAFFERRLGRKFQDQNPYAIRGIRELGLNINRLAKAMGDVSKITAAYDQNRLGRIEKIIASTQTRFGGGVIKKGLVPQFSGKGSMSKYFDAGGDGEEGGKEGEKKAGSAITGWLRAGFRGITGGASVNVGSMASAFGGAYTAAGGGAAGLGAGIGAIASALGPIAIAAAGIFILVKIVSKIFKLVWGMVKKSEAVGAFSDLSESVVTSLVDTALYPMLAALNGFTFGDMSNEGILAFGESIKTLANHIGTILKPVWDAFALSFMEFTSFVGKMMETFSWILPFLVELEVLNRWMTGILPLFAFLSGYMVMLYASIQPILDILGPFIATYGALLVESFGSFLEIMWQTIGPILQIIGGLAALQYVVMVILPALLIFVSILSALAVAFMFIQTVVSSVMIVVKFFAGIIIGLMDAFGILGPVVSAFNWVLGALKAVFMALKSAVEWLIKPFQDFLDIFKQFNDFAKGGGSTEAGRNMVQGIRDWAGI